MKLYGDASGGIMLEVYLYTCVYTRIYIYLYIYISIYVHVTMSSRIYRTNIYIYIN